MTSTKLDKDALDWLCTVRLNSPMLTPWQYGAACALQGAPLFRGASPPARAGYAAGIEARSLLGDFDAFERDLISGK
jgi:hypothetical protein